jgi:hypothetical protein
MRHSLCVHARSDVRSIRGTSRSAAPQEFDALYKADFGWLAKIIAGAKILKLD